MDGEYIILILIIIVLLINICDIISQIMFDKNDNTRP